MIILDFGSGNTCRNNTFIVRNMIRRLAEITNRRDIVIKWQLFERVPPNKPLEHEVFDMAYKLAKYEGFETTASVFDLPSLRFLLRYDIPFVKLANRVDTHWLSGEVPRRIPIVQSHGSDDGISHSEAEFPLCCVSEYPATPETYKMRFRVPDLRYGISDHTVGFELYTRYKPMNWEKHYVLEHSEDNPDAGPFAVTPEELQEVLR
jgi:sialic acid synthase SpsE